MREGASPAPWAHTAGGADPNSRRFGPPTAILVWLPVVISFIVQVPTALLSANRQGTSHGVALVMVILAMVGPLALIGARRFPGPVVAIAAAAACADLLFTPGSGAPYLALAFAVISAMARGARVWAFTSVAAGWALVLAGSLTLGLNWHPARVVLTSLGILVVMVIGEGLRTRGERMRQYQAAARKRREDTAQAERVRIARELHDVLAHSLSQINVQAGMGLHLIDSHPEKAREALSNIKSTSKTALDEVRGVLGFLRSEGAVGHMPVAELADPVGSFVSGGVGSAANDEFTRDTLANEASLSVGSLAPQADLSRLPSLVGAVSASGLDVQLDNRLHSEPPPGVQLALYRITQESLTNVTRHAHATRASVVLDERAGDYVLAVTDNGTTVMKVAPVSGGSAPGEGRGLIGMRERAELLGGHLEAGPAAGGGFSVVATLPGRRQS
ncbi:hypothetical protein BH09ACT6_BH09ACT6_02210 [soil metagenome]